MLPFLIQAFIDFFDPSYKNRPKDAVLLKPTWAKILLLWPVMVLLELIFVFLISREKILQAPMLAIIIPGIYLLGATFFFLIILLHLPYYVIEISNGHLIGPSLWGTAWRRVFIPVDEIDIRATNTSLQILGFYVMKSRQGEKILVWGFDIAQFEKLLIALKQARDSAILNEVRE